MLTLMKYEDYNDLILKNDDTRKLNIEMATCMMALTNTHGALGEVSLANGYCEKKMIIRSVCFIIADVFTFVKKKLIKEKKRKKNPKQCMQCFNLQSFNCHKLFYKCSRNIQTASVMQRK